MSDSLRASLTLLGVVAGVLALLTLLAVAGKVPIKYNVRNLVVRWRTTLLAALAFPLVVGLMTVMLAFVNGMYRLTENSGQPGNVIVLAEGATDEAFSGLGFGDVTQVQYRDGVQKDEEGKPLASWEVYIVVNQPIPNARPGGRQRRFLQVRGLDDPARSGRVHALPLYEGGAWFSDAGVQPIPGSPTGEQAIQVVLGEGIARELGPDQGKPSLRPGDSFPMADRQWAVVGVLHSGGSTFDSEIWAKRQIVGPMFGKESYTTAVLRTAGPEEAKALSEDLSANFKPAVQAQPETDYYDKLSVTNRQFLVATIFVAFWMAVGGVFGVMNTMFAAISQRSKDIGVLRILGYARWQLLVSFFLESMLLAVVGGLVGCAAGYLCDGWTASSIVSSGQGGGKSVVLKLIVDSRILLGCMLFALGMGALGGLVPALTAMSGKPLQAVR
jgi:ABC-type antimicrobial peptide transport system permease subunit